MSASRVQDARCCESFVPRVLFWLLESCEFACLARPRLFQGQEVESLYAPNTPAMLLKRKILFVCQFVEALHVPKILYMPGYPKHD